MQEIAPHIYVETSYAGVTLGAISFSHGLILIDAPFRPEDIRSWRSTLLNLGGGVDRLLINMDAHTDRILGARAMECTVVGHEELAEAFQSRAIALKLQAGETGAEWERYDNLGSVRWALPEITFTNELIIHWDNEPVILEYAPGSSLGSVWAKLPESHIIFLGDLVTPNQPPFLALADLPVWMETLQKLLKPEYSDYLMISGRDGMVRSDQVRKQYQVLENIHNHLEALAKKGCEPKDTLKILPNILSSFSISTAKEEQFSQRLSWGLFTYFAKKYCPNILENIEE
jgi:glyoxylase-like metal-dependent hydrolase (beta-lactamase superfamily II)